MNIISNSKSEGKSLIMKKITMEDQSFYQEHLNHIFTDPNQYFSTEFKGSSIIIGQPYNKGTNKYIPKNKRSILGNRASRGSNYGLVNYNQSRKRTSNMSGMIPSHSLLPPNKYYIDDKELKGIFDNFKQIKENNTQVTLPINTTHKLYHDTHNSQLLLQQKALSNHITLQKESKALSFKIAKKLNTKPDTLLMMTDGGFRIKNELKDDCSKQIQSKASKPFNNWLLTLRNDNDHRYLNVGTVKYPKWQRLITKKNQKEVIRDPKRNDRQATSFFISNDYLKDKISLMTYDEFKTANTINLKNLEVKGKDLLQAEYENIKEIKGKKIITKIAKNEDEELLNDSMHDKMIIDNKLLPPLHRKYASF